MGSGCFTRSQALLLSLIQIFRFPSSIQAQDDTEEFFFCPSHHTVEHYYPSQSSHATTFSDQRPRGPAARSARRPAPISRRSAASSSRSTRTSSCSANAALCSTASLSPSSVASSEQIDVRHFKSSNKFPVSLWMIR